MANQPVKRKPTLPGSGDTPETLFHDLQELIRESRQGLARSVNTAMVLLYWRVGERIYRHILAGKRADYGESILLNLSKRLTTDFGRGFSPPNLSRMLRFHEHFTDYQIVSTLSKQLGSFCRVGHPGERIEAGILRRDVSA